MACNRQARAGASSAVPGLVADRSKKWFPASKPSAHLLGSRRNTAAWWPAGSASRYALTCTRVSKSTIVQHQELAPQVGSANGRNPIAIIIPGHRVLGQDGRLHGYAGGLPIKQRLLQHEGAWLSQQA